MCTTNVLFQFALLLCVYTTSPASAVPAPMHSGIGPSLPAPHIQKASHQAVVFDTPLFSEGSGFAESTFEFPQQSEEPSFSEEPQMSGEPLFPAEPFSWEEPMYSEEPQPSSEANGSEGYSDHSIFWEMAKAVGLENFFF